VRRFNGPNFLQVYGNHDSLLKHEGVPAIQRIRVGTFTLEVRHGHRFRGLDLMLEPLKYPIKWMAGRDQRRSSGRLGAALYGINDFLTQPSGPEQVSTTTKSALGHLECSDEINVLVCGHDHNISIHETSSGIYANSGTCGYGRLDWLSIDMAQGTVRAMSGHQKSTSS
jgi:predicted phosphodiesterase